MSDTSGDIIIKGGSCEIFFDHIAYKKDSGDDKKRRHDTAEIEQIIIEGHGKFPDYDSGVQGEAFKGTIKIKCKRED